MISFSLLAGEALAQAAHPEMPMMRLRSGAVSLTREARIAERQLEKVQEARAMGVEPDPRPEPESPKIEKTTALIEDNRKIAAYAKAHGLTWTQALQQRERDKRLTERARKPHERERKAGAVPALA